MILADTRHHLTRDDAQLAARILARDSGDELGTLETKLADEGIDAILDDPRLPSALLRHPRGAHASFTLFAYVMVRQALQNAGESDRGMADYVSSLVIHFGFRDRSHRISPADDEIYGALAQLLDDINDPDARRAFLVRTHLGNYIGVDEGALARQRDRDRLVPRRHGVGVYPVALRHLGKAQEDGIAPFRPPIGRIGRILRPGAGRSRRHNQSRNEESANHEPPPSAAKVTEMRPGG